MPSAGILQGGLGNSLKPNMSFNQPAQVLPLGVLRVLASYGDTILNNTSSGNTILNKLQIMMT